MWDNAFMWNITEQAAVNAFAEVTGNVMFWESVACHPSVDGWLAVIISCLSYVPCALLTNDCIFFAYDRLYVMQSLSEFADQT